MHYFTTSLSANTASREKDREREREQERRREFITRKKDRENKQIRTCVPVLLNGRMAYIVVDLASTMYV